MKSSQSALADSPAALRPRCHRQELRSLVYVSVSQTNGGILRNVSESGVAIQMLAAPKVGQAISLRFELLNPRARLETSGRVVWIDQLGLAGVQFRELPQSSRRGLKEWIFTQLLASAERDCSSAMFSCGAVADLPEGICFSSESRPAIRIAQRRSRASDSIRSLTLNFSWWPFDIAAQSFANGIDVLILTCAVLLFTLTSLFTMRALPPWPLALALVAGASAAFLAAYWLLFSFWCGITPGQHLAKLASASESQDEKQTVPRFR